MSEESLLHTEAPLVEGVPSGKEEASSSPLSSTNSPQAREMSAASLARLMGIATTSDLQLMEGKLDALSTKIMAMTLKIDKLASIAAGFPSGHDFERIDLQIAGLRNFIKETVHSLGGEHKVAESSSTTSATALPSTGGTSTSATSGATKKARPAIFVSKPQEPTPS